MLNIAQLLFAPNLVAFSCEVSQVELCEKIKTKRKSVGFSQTMLAQNVDVSMSTVRRWETGDRLPDANELSRLAAALNTSVAYLLGESDFPGRPDGLSGSLLGMDNPSPPKQEMEETRIDPSTIQVINEMVSVQVLDIRTCAGNGSSHMFEDVEVLYEIQLPAMWVGPISPYDDKKPFLTKIDGDSMSDAGFHNGMLALINPAADVYGGEPALVCFGPDRSTAIKRVFYLPDRVIELRSDSPGYPVYTYTYEQQKSEENPLIIIGRVMGAWVSSTKK
jgi:transcriptional regulator with XRE-family HTH domain